MALRRLEVTVPATFDDVTTVRSLLAAAAAGVPISRATLLRVEICLVEALNNVVRHSYAGRDDGEVRIAFDASPQRLVIEIVDRGAPMPEAVRHRIRTTPPIGDRDVAAVDDLPEGGFGIPILRTVLDGIEYRREGDRNVLTLVKEASEPRLPLSAPAT